jgi:hypothetical protein
MQDLSNNILDYYWRHFNDLPFNKQFHLASRLYLWNQDAKAREKLAELRANFTAQDDPARALDELITIARNSPTYGSKNAAELRRPYFEEYPQLKIYVTTLFRITFLKQIYNIDARQLFYQHFAKVEVEAFATRLLSDPRALAILSTHAVNFLYLYSRVILEDDSYFDSALFLEVGGSQYDTSDRLHLQLLIYLYTHCIIGESKFYYRALPDTETYVTMIRQLETLIDEQFEAINLDNKFEFLVCAKLIGISSRLQDRIYDEARQSVSDTGLFLVDRHNSNPQPVNVTLVTSEHRNALFIMSTLGFKPLT